jgi:hypothetical protein
MGLDIVHHAWRFFGELGLDGAENMVRAAFDTVINYKILVFFFFIHMSTLSPWWWISPASLDPSSLEG